MDADREFWMAVRRALLIVLDALERRLCISPTTAELRRTAKGEIMAATIDSS